MSAPSGTRVTADPVEIARGLIQRRSVTPADDGALAYCAELLRRAGFAVDTVVLSGPGAPDTPNLYARIGDGRPCLAFAGHTDVVPPGEAARWRHDPFSGAVEDGWLYGRGAADMKGGVAAMIAAAADFVGARGGDFGGSIAFLLTGDEEGPAANGTVKLLKWAAGRGAAFDHCLLGEPTNPERLGEMAKIGRRGSLTGRVQVRGRQGHVAYPDLAVNPIPALARIVTELAGTPLDEGTAHFSPSHLEWTTVDVGNPATNVIPSQARATFNVRFNDLWRPATLAAALARRMAEAAGPVPFVLDFAPTNSVAFVTEPDAFARLLQDVVEEETGIRPSLSTTGGTSDARFIKDHCPVIEFGLVGQTMHAADERVRVEDLVRLKAIYRSLLERYFPVDR